MHCKSLWIKASAKCKNLKVSSHKKGILGVYDFLLSDESNQIQSVQRVRSRQSSDDHVITVSEDEVRSDLKRVKVRKAVRPNGITDPLQFAQTDLLKMPSLTSCTLPSHTLTATMGTM